MRKHRSVKPVERHIAPIDHFDQRIEHLGLLTDLVAKAEMILAFDETQRLHAIHGAMLQSFNSDARVAGLSFVDDALHDQAQPKGNAYVTATYTIGSTRLCGEVNLCRLHRRG